MALQNTDLLLVERSGVKYQMTADQLADFLGAVKDYSVSDIAARDALTDLKVGDRVFVADATADATVEIGWAIYRVNAVGPITYGKIQEQESLDVVVGNSDLGYTASATEGVVTNSNGTSATIPAVTITNAGLATPAMLAASHQPATATGTSATNPIVIGANQELSFSIGNLTTLP